MATNEMQERCRTPRRLRFVSCKGAGKLTSLSRQTWWLFAKTGVVEHVRIGGRILIPRSEVDRLIAEGRRPRRAEVAR
jgi:hypothetical protein